MNNFKKLTLSFPFRNDDYYLNAIHRLNFSLEYNCWLINKLKLKNFIDIVVVDWGSNIPLSKNLNILQQNHEIIKFIQINKNISSKESEVDFHISKANNSAIRKSNSEFILYTAHDLLFSETALLNLYNLLHYKYLSIKKINNSLVNIQRFFLPAELFLFTPSFEYLSKWIKTSSLLYGDLSGNTGEGKAGHLASKKFWNKIGAINENFSLYGQTDTDVHSRANMIAPYYDSFNFGINLYKMPRGVELGRKKALLNLNTNWTSFDPKVNNKNWGLNKYHIPLSKPLKTSKKNNLRKLKIIENIPKKNYINVLFSIFSVSVSLRIFYVKMSKIILFQKINNLIKIGNTRSFICFGYDDPYGLLFIAKNNCATDITVLDNVKLAAEKKHKKNNKNNFEESSIGILFERSMIVGIAKNRFFSKLINHLGYFRMINKIEEKQLNDIFDNMTKDENSNSLLFLESEIEHLKTNSIQKIINKNTKKIFSIFFYGSKIRNINLKDFEIINLKSINIKIFIKNNKLLNTSNYQKLKENTKINFLFYFILTNFILLFCNIRRAIRSLFFKIFKLNSEDKLL